MKYPTLSFFALLICCFFYSSLGAQRISAEHPNDRFVIAFSGLKLRSTPQFDGKVIEVLPFGSKVRALEDITYYFSNGKFIISPDSIWGRFVEVVSEKGKRGFVFGAYLTKYGTYYKLDQPMHFLLSLSDCLGPVVSNEYIYHTVIVDTLSNKAWIKKQVPSIMGGDPYFKDRGVAFIIATKEPFVSEGEIANSTDNCNKWAGSYSWAIKKGEKRQIPAVLLSCQFQSLRTHFSKTLPSFGVLIRRQVKNT